MPLPPGSPDALAVSAHARRLAVVLEVLALLALVSGFFPLALSSPIWWLRLGDSLVNLAPVLLLAVILLRFASFTLKPDADEDRRALSRQTVQLAGLRNRLNAAGSEVELRLQASTIPGLLPPLIPGSLAQQKAQLSESLDLNRSGLQTNLNRQRTSTVVNSLTGTLRVLLGGIFNNGGAAHVSAEQSLSHRHPASEALSSSASDGGVFAGVASALAKMRTKMRITCVCNHANHAGAA